MEHQEKEVYFSNETLARFVTAQGRSVEKIVCHLWQNKMHKSETVEIIDNLVIHFRDQHQLAIACNHESDGLEAIDFDFDITAHALEEEFEGKIKLFAIDASATKMWEDVIGQTLQLVRITKKGEYYKADSIILDFGKEKREISISPLDGIIIDYYEED
jgi:hypothetical protein